MKTKAVAALLILLSYTNIGFADDTYEVDKVLDNGYYIINGLVWEPHNNCPTLREGDPVTFVEGSPNGNCVSAIILDHNSNTNCKLWCKEDDL